MISISGVRHDSHKNQFLFACSTLKKVFMDPEYLAVKKL
jgi:hypothetical protein